MNNTTAFIALSVMLLASAATAQSIEDPTPAFEPTSPLSYGRTNIKDEGSLTAGIWYSQAEALSVSLGVEQNGLFDTDENFRLSLEASAYTQNASITLTDPDFYETEYSRQLAFSIYNIEPNRYQNGDFAFSGARASISFGRRLSDDLSISFGAGVAQTRVKESAVLPVYISDYIAQEGEKDTSFFSFANVLLDRTDGGLRPTSGYQLGLANELGTVDGTAYYKSQASAHHFTPLSDRVNLHLQGNVATGGVFGSGTYPIFDNYFAGGPGSVRGYAQNTLGPTSAIPDSTQLAYTGGTFRLTGGAELSSKFMDREDLFALAFIDFGNVFVDAGSASSDELRGSIGLGARWDSPIGPISIYYSHPLNDEPTDNLEQFQFTLGARF